MKLHPQYRTYIMSDLPGLSRDVAIARRLVQETGRSYSWLAREIGVTKDMVAKVLTGRRTSKRVLDGIVELCRARLADGGQRLREIEAALKGEKE